MSKVKTNKKCPKEGYIKSTIDGKLYIETEDLFSQEKVKEIIRYFLKSDILKSIDERRDDKKEDKAIA